MSKDQRNILIYEEHLFRGIKVGDLAIEYNLSTTSIRHIIDNQHRRAKRRYQSISRIEDNIKKFKASTAEAVKLLEIVCNSHGLETRMSIDDIELGCRAKNALKRIGVFYLSDIEEHTEAQLAKTPNFGKRSFAELKGVLLEYGYRFKNEEE